MPDQFAKQVERNINAISDAIAKHSLAVLDRLPQDNRVRYKDEMDRVLTQTGHQLDALCYWIGRVIAAEKLALTPDTKKPDKPEEETGDK